MLASELVGTLQTLIDTHGDRRIVIYDDSVEEDYSRFTITPYPGHADYGDIYQIEILPEWPDAVPELPAGAPSPLRVDSASAGNTHPTDTHRPPTGQ